MSNATILDPYIPAPPEQQLRNLQLILLERSRGYRTLENYYAGNHPNSYSTEGFNEVFGTQLRTFRDNWMRMVIESTVNRLCIQGFRTGGPTTSDLSLSSNRAWEIFRSNRLESESIKAHRDAMKFGRSYLIVNPTPTVRSPDGLAPSITVQSPINVYALPDPNDRFRCVQAIKRWIGAFDGYMYANLYLPDMVINYKSKNPVPFANQPLNPEIPLDYSEIGYIENPLGFVPVIQLENQPTLLVPGTSDLEDLIPMQDGLNKTIRDLMVASEYQAFRRTLGDRGGDPQRPGNAAAAESGAAGRLHDETVGFRVPGSESRGFLAGGPGRLHDRHRHVHSPHRDDLEHAGVPPHRQNGQHVGGRDPRGRTRVRGQVPHQSPGLRGGVGNSDRPRHQHRQGGLTLRRL